MLTVTDPEAGATQHVTLDHNGAQAFAVRLRYLRSQAGLSQEEAAHQAGVSRNHYQLLESGRSSRTKGTRANPRLSTVINIVAMLGCEWQELLGDPPRLDAPEAPPVHAN
ncbi:MAG: helix-turn-helix domain-containing protein [Promicromonosporaceae bacterium]|nr:helix-turn-helix domain-containing protein [Promicromonosporaceae bacterium]